MAEGADKLSLSELAAASDRARSFGLAAEAQQITTFGEQATQEGTLHPDHARWLAHVLTILGFGQAALPWFAMAVGEVEDAPAKAAEMRAFSAIEACQWHVQKLQTLQGEVRLQALDLGTGPMLQDLVDNPVPERALRLLDPLRQIAALVMEVSWRRSHLVADVLEPLLRHGIDAGAIPFNQVHEDFNTAWHLIWKSAWGLESLLSLDPFVDLLAAQARTHLGPTWKRKSGLSDGKPGVAYLTPILETDRGIGSATHSLAKFHADTHPEHRVYLYMMKPPDAGVEAFHANSNVTVRFVEDISEVFLAQLDDDGIDVVLTDNFFWFTICMLAVRIAPIQILLDMTHVYDNLGEVDWWFIGSGDYRAVRGMPCDKLSALPFDRFDDTVRQPDPDKVAAIRSGLGDGPVIGYIGRLIKFTDEMLAIARNILIENPEAQFLICGPGDATPMHALQHDTEIGARVHVVNEYVDVEVHGPAIDVFLDSHPFTGGETCREVMSYGVPVVTFENPDFAPLIEVGRDPELVVGSRADYIKTVGRMIAEPDFRSLKSSTAQEIAARRGDMSINVDVIVTKMNELLDKARS